MLSSSNPVPKLYLSIIEDVIESMRELFLDEGLEERVLEDLRKLWESKVMQSKAVEGFRNDTLNPSNFVLQLPANYAHTLHKPTASIVIPAGQNIQNFTTKASSTGSLATFALPPGVSYPVQIPGGVTLQTTSGQLYKVNVPVMVTQAPAGHRILPQSVQHLIEQKEPQASQGAVTPTILQTMAPGDRPVHPLHLLGRFSTPEVQQQQVLLTQSTPPNPPATQPPVILQAPQLPPDSPGDSPFTLDGIEFSPQPLDMSLPVAPSAQLSGLQAPSCQMPVLGSEVSVQGEEEVPKEEAGAAAKQAEEASPEAPAKLEAGLMHDYSHTALGDIVQLDGPCGSSSEEEDGGDEGVPDAAVAGENEFLGMISAEALRALQEGEDSSPGGSSDSDSDKEEEPLVEEEEDPLNSGDDVSEQDVPDLFDTDNVVVCQYDKIHRSKNRWKFYLKDGVMCLGGKDYVFSKAVGEAEW